MGYNFKNIDYSRQLYESLRNYFAVNAAGQISMLYKILLCYLMPLQQPFADYDAFRQKMALIAQCNFQVGQLTNVLNMLYDPALLRIYITQATTSNLQAQGWAYKPLIQARGFAEPAQVQARGFKDSSSRSVVTINVPAVANIVDLTATVELIRLKGIPYKIQTF